MAQINAALPPAAGAAHEFPEPSDAAWREVVELLQRAAQLAAERGQDTELFMEAAWTACLDARPGLREQLEHKQLKSQLKKLRKRGLVAAA